jgi:Ca2+-binding RTX toxin-like protein
MFGGDGVDVLIGGAGNDYFDGGTGVNYYFGGSGGGPGTGIGNDTFVFTASGAASPQAPTRTPNAPTVDVVQDWTEGLDHVNLAGTGFTSFNDLLSHSYQNGAYFVIQPDANNAMWLNGAMASSISASDFSIVS